MFLQVLPDRLSFGTINISLLDQLGSPFRTDEPDENLGFGWLDI
jgi:hypothetical protein